MTKKKSNKSAIRTDKDKEVARRNRAIYSATDPTSGYPKGLGLISVPLRAGAALFNPDEMQYEVTDAVADAAWRKRLGLSYDDKLLIENKDGSYRLPKNIEMEIPTDTTFIKNRIAANKKLANQSNIMGDDWKLIDSMIDLDNQTLDSLRHTYKTGEPVVINEFSNNSRRLANNGELIEGAHNYKTPLNVLQNYTVQYDPKSNTMRYRDTYDFNGFETFIPGEPFEISGSIPLNKYSIGGWFKDTTASLGKWNTGITDKLMGSKFGQGLSNLGIKSGGLGGIANTAATAVGGLLAGQNKTGVGSAMQTIGSLASNIPGVGGLIGAGVNMVGGLVNAAFGSNINKEFVNQTESQARQQANYLSGATDTASLLSDWNALTFLGDVKKSDVGSDGWFSNKAGRETDRLNTLVDEANMRALASLSNTAENIDKQNDLMLMANYRAYGGPIDMKYTGVMSPFGNQFKDGGIYIKPSKRGTFTAAAKKRGMGVQEFASKVLANKEDYSPAMVKKANFARNASKWKHADGGPLDTRMELLRRLEEKRNRRGNYSGGEFGGAGASSLFLESPDNYTLVKDTVWVPYRETFNDAFSRARAAGLDEFIFDNKLYNTELGDNPDNNRAGEERVIEGLLPVERTRKVKNIKADGGFTNNVITVGNGGTHEDNPYEGVQMGVDPQGVPNLVEEGEVVYDDYVFSNRLRVPKEVRQKYKLRGVTFADAAKQLQKESEERPNDPISKKGLEASMKMLMSEQEMIRDKKENNKYAKGGKLGRLYEGEGPDSQWLYKPVTPGFVPKKEDILAEMEAMYPSLTKKPELTQSDRTMLGRDLLSYTDSKEEVEPMKTSWLRYAPIVGSGLAVANDLFGGNEPDYSNATMFERAIEGTNRPVRARQIGNYLTYRPFDRDYYINKLNADTAAGRRAIANTSGGNRAAAMAGILSSDYNYGNQLGALARQAEEYNLAQRQAVEQFNRGTNITNAEMAMKADLANAEQAMQRARMYGSLAEYRDSILARNRAEKSANLTNFIQGLGDLGTELTDKDKLRWLADLGVLKYDDEGKYTGKKSKKKRGGFTI